MNIMTKHKKDLIQPRPPMTSIGQPIKTTEPHKTTSKHSRPSPASSFPTLATNIHTHSPANKTISLHEDASEANSKKRDDDKGELIKILFKATANSKREDEVRCCRYFTWT
jgi:hypothetical protein